MTILFRQLQEELFKGNNASDENPRAETTKDFAVRSEVLEASEHKLTSPQVNTNLLIQISNILLFV